MDAEGGDTEELSQAREILQAFLLEHVSVEAVGPEAPRISQKYLRRLEAMSHLLPENPLDTIIEELGGKENVAELTGRVSGNPCACQALPPRWFGSMCADCLCVDSPFSFSSCRLQALRPSTGGDGPSQSVTVSHRTHEAERLAFQTGKKRVAVISEAASGEAFDL